MKTQQSHITNYIPINRKLFEHPFWREGRAFSRFEAWLDLLVSARYLHTETSVLVKGCLVVFGRGELPASIRFLAQRWGWTKSRTENFLNLLKREGMVKTRTPNGTGHSVITICKYDTYNFGFDGLLSNAGHPADTLQTPGGHPADKYNIDNKVTNEKERKVYRAFNHLILFETDFQKLMAAGFSKAETDGILDEIENYKGNKKYVSLYLTAKKWLEKNRLAPRRAATTPTQPKAPANNRINQIAGVFERALQHG